MDKVNKYERSEFSEKGFIIGVSGKIGSGKDAVGDYLKKYGFRTENLAANVRRVCSILTGVSYETLLHRESKGIRLYDNTMSMGELFQIIGNGLREIVDEDVWLDSLFNNLKSTDLIVITDVRYPNEVKEIERRGGVVIRINGDPIGIRESIRTGKSSDKRDLNAPSETSLDSHEFNYVIENNGTLEDLHRKVDNIIKGLEFNKNP